MIKTMCKDAEQMIAQAIDAVLPDTAMRNAMTTIGNSPSYVLAIGKAAWRMAKTASEVLGENMIKGVVVTKYGHAKEPIDRMAIYEAGHPIPDANSLMATKEALAMVRGLKETDRLLFLVSGGGSALFEALPDDVSLASLMQLTSELLASGADIEKINTVRKHLSLVKGGKLARQCAPAQVVNVILSDVIGDPLDAIASGPACADQTTTQDALKILEDYHISVSEEIKHALTNETPKTLENTSSYVIGNVRSLCEHAAHTAREKGYHPVILSTTLDCEAREAGAFFAAIARQMRTTERPFPLPCALIAGGETVVHLKGKGKGGRNQEMALAAAKGISGLENTLFFSVGSDGTDGPTDAAGGMVDGDFYQICSQRGFSVEDTLQNNDAYSLLHDMDGLIVTGPTGTNVNDLSVLLMR